MSMCKVPSCVVGRGCLLWPVHFLVKTLLAFALLHSSFQGQIYSQSYGFSSSHVWMWELDHKEGWVPKNWCFQIVALENTLESPLDCKEILPVHPKGNQSLIFIGRTDVEAIAPVLWLPDAKCCLIRKDSYWVILKVAWEGLTEGGMVG